MMVLNRGSCFWLLESGNGCRHPGKGSIRNLKQLVQMAGDAFQPVPLPD